MSSLLLIEHASDEKLRGGFYTPPEVASFILRWAANGNRDYDVLEPSCGDGVFLAQMRSDKFQFKSLTAVEINAEEAQKARQQGLPRTKVLVEDFLRFSNRTTERFDLVVGNPPYIRYQYFNEEQRTEAIKIFERAGLRYSKLANAWVSFVVGSTRLLKPRGKMAFVLPAEILQVGYARRLRVFLAKQFNKINIVSFRRLIFPEAQQEVVLLLCERTGEETHLIEHIEVADPSHLDSLNIANLKRPRKRIDFHTNKWTFYFLEQDEIDFIEGLLKQKKIRQMRQFATVEVGMTTGGNKFFTVAEDVVKAFRLKPYAKPMVGRSVQVSSAIFDQDDWLENVREGARAFFLKFPPRSKLPERVVEYIRQGEASGVSALYKCRIRDEWQIVPSAWVSQALFVRRNNIYPRLILNDARAYTTDTMHRVTIRRDATLAGGAPIDIRALVASYYNSLSFAFAEICGRSHGGGVLELMPNEVEDILVPYNIENAALLPRIDKMLRSGRTIDDVLRVTDAFILKQQVGLSDAEIAIANGIWKKLLARRLARNQAGLPS